VVAQVQAHGLHGAVLEIILVGGVQYQKTIVKLDVVQHFAQIIISLILMVKLMVKAKVTVKVKVMVKLLIYAIIVIVVVQITLNTHIVLRAIFMELGVLLLRKIVMHVLELIVEKLIIIDNFSNILIYNIIKIYKYFLLLLLKSSFYIICLNYKIILLIINKYKYIYKYI